MICQFKMKVISAEPLSEQNVKMKSPEANLYGLCGRMNTQALILRWKRPWKDGKGGVRGPHGLRTTEASRLSFQLSRTWQG